MLRRSIHRIFVKLVIGQYGMHGYGAHELEPLAGGVGIRWRGAVIGSVSFRSLAVKLSHKPPPALLAGVFSGRSVGWRSGAFGGIG